MVTFAAASVKSTGIRVVILAIEDACHTRKSEIMMRGVPLTVITPVEPVCNAPVSVNVPVQVIVPFTRKVCVPVEHVGVVPRGIVVLAATVKSALVLLSVHVGKV